MKKNNKKIVLLLLVLTISFTILVGCSKTDNSEAVMNAKLDQIASDVQIAKAEAERANQRLDNLTRGYKK